MTMCSMFSNLLYFLLWFLMARTLENNLIKSEIIYSDCLGLEFGLDHQLWFRPPKVYSGSQNLIEYCKSKYFLLKLKVMIAAVVLWKLCYLHNFVCRCDLSFFFFTILKTRTRAVMDFCSLIITTYWWISFSLNWIAFKQTISSLQPLFHCNERAAKLQTLLNRMTFSSRRHFVTSWINYNYRLLKE